MQRREHQPKCSTAIDWEGVDGHGRAWKGMEGRWKAHLEGRDDRRVHRELEQRRHRTEGDERAALEGLPLVVALVAEAVAVRRLVGGEVLVAALAARERSVEAEARVGRGLRLLLRARPLGRQVGIQQRGGDGVRGGGEERRGHEGVAAVNERQGRRLGCE